MVGGKNEDKPLMSATSTDDQMDTLTVEINMQTCMKNIELGYKE